MSSSVLILFYWDICGPCQHFLRTVWNQLPLPIPKIQIEKDQQTNINYLHLSPRHIETIRRKRQDIRAFPSVYSLNTKTGDLTPIENRSKEYLMQVARSSHGRRRSTRKKKLIQTKDKYKHYTYRKKQINGT